MYANHSGFYIPSQSKGVYGQIQDLSNASMTKGYVGISLTETTTVQICLGYTVQGLGSGNSTAIAFDNVTLTKYESEAAALALADETHPIDVSYRLADPLANTTWSRDDGTSTNWSTTANVDNTGGDFPTQSTANGNKNLYWEAYRSSAAAGRWMYQVVSGLPSGSYTFRAAAMANTTSDGVVLYAGNGTTTVNSGNRVSRFYSVTGTIDGSSLEVGLKQETAVANWFAIAQTGLFYNGVTIDQLKSQFSALVTSSNDDYLNNDEYEIVAGSDRSALIAAQSAPLEETKPAYLAAIDALNVAIGAFSAAKGQYEALAAKKIEAASYTSAAWPYASAAKRQALDDAVNASATSGADADVKSAAITTAIRQFVESNGLAEGVAAAVDYTSSLLVSDAAVSASGWTSGSIGTNQGESYTDGNGEITTKYFDGGWANNAGANVNVTQSLTLPAGEYLLQITARGATNLTAYSMSVGGESVDLPKAGADVNEGTFGRGWSDKYLTFISTGEAVTLSIVATSTDYYQWISFNRLRLHKLDATLADDDDYAALNAAIATAEGNTLGFKVGEYAPYENVAALELLAAAKAIDQDASNEQATVQDATTALSGATWTANTVEKAIIYNSNFAEADGNNPKGWTRSNGAWGQQQTGLGADTDNGTAWYYNTSGAWEYGKKVGYNMPLEANTVYLLEFKYRSHETNSNNNLTASVLNDSNEGLSATAVGANKTITFVKKSLTFKTGAAGDYVLSLLQDGNTWVTDVYLTKVPAIVKTSSANLQGYKTFYNADVNYEVDANTTIYKAAAPNTGYVTLTEVNADRIIPAGTPVILKTSNTTDYKMTLTPTATASENVFDGNVLQVADETGTIDGAYILAYKNPNFGFFQYTGSLDAGDIYLTAPASSAKGRLIITIDGEATGIEAVETVEADDNAPAYNVAGQPVTKDYKGIVIKNGKKYLQK